VTDILVEFVPPFVPVALFLGTVAFVVLRTALFMHASTFHVVPSLMDGVAAVIVWFVAVVLAVLEVVRVAALIVGRVVIVKVPLLLLAAQPVIVILVPTCKKTNCAAVQLVVKVYTPVPLPTEPVEPEVTEKPVSVSSLTPKKIGGRTLVAAALT